MERERWERERQEKNSATCPYGSASARRVAVAQHRRTSTVRGAMEAEVLQVRSFVVALLMFLLAPAVPCAPSLRGEGAHYFISSRSRGANDP
eukprot:gene7838-5469_t